MCSHPIIPVPITPYRTGSTEVDCVIDRYATAVSDLAPLPSSRRLGASDLDVGPVAYGCWRLAGDLTSANASIGAALDHGMTLIDTADIYGWDGARGFGDAEDLLGRVLAGAPGWRDRMVLATKGGIRPPVPYDQSRAYLRSAVEASLRRLRTETIDLYQVHRPDLLTGAVELGSILDELVDSGKVRAIGVSNFSVGQHRALAAHLRAPICTTQPEWHPLRQEPLVDGTLDLCEETGCRPLVWSPLAGGRLTGSIVALDPDAARVATVAERIAAEQGVTREAVLVAWIAHHPSGAIPIVGTTQPARIAAAAAATSVRLTRTEWYEVLVAGRGEPMP